ncbi:hypothetical protein EW026_g6648 [Hermanssonia centrifuga]|uniref:GATA-type domain-containing protein n=1 Tax=Hermanssonia centrifuga TaxID=98765 RepID=A0A4S4KBB3_9APHY|nr:hypothetical protein EW026_g6648 [Hermanssonia centrifuga]
MPHRVDSGDRNGQGRPDERAQYEHPGSHPSPPPIATLHSSPAPSAENSSLTSPSPPLSQPGYYQGSAQNGPGMHPGSYTYAPAPHARYPADPASAHQMQSHYPPSSHYQPQQSAQQPAYIVHTDDAATKLNDRVRRKCYNCRTTDTSTWRRSSLAPGKVLCNKCGLFERTHSRPRPEQFPHKRGPIVTTTFKSSRSPPPPQASRLPPIQQQMSLPPHHYDHPSIAPLLPRSDSQGSYASNGSNSLPEIRNLLNSPQQSGAAQQAASQQQPSSANGDANSLKRAHSPASPSARSPRADRSPPYMYRTNSVAATAAA